MVQTLLALSLIALVTGSVIDNECNTTITQTLQQACHDDLRDDGTNCWRDSYGRGVGRVPDKAPCGADERDDGTSCWLDSYGRGAGRLADKSPCPSGLRDDGTSCWSDAHIYEKGCCCTLWGCCNNCSTGYHDDGCTCRKMDVGIKVTLFERQSCHDDEDLKGGLCYPRCKAGYHSVGCCVCEPDGGQGIVTSLKERQSCNSDEQRYGGLCYPKCKAGYHAVGCCICEPDGGPGIEMYPSERKYCAGSNIMFNGVCMDISNCTSNQIIANMEETSTMSPEQKEELLQLYP